MISCFGFTYFTHSFIFIKFFVIFGDDGGHSVLKPQKVSSVTAVLHQSTVNKLSESTKMTTTTTNMTTTPTFVPHHPTIFSKVVQTRARHSITRRQNTVRLPPQRSSSTRRIVPIQLADKQPKTSTPIPLAPPTSDIWELDFYSRPVVGLDGKKLWELIITDATASFEFVESVPNSLVNSRELRKRIQAVIDNSRTKPTTIRFFRSQMQNMIEIALSGIDASISPSRKTYALYKLLQRREATVYKQMPGYKAQLAQTASASSYTPINFTLAKRLPDALRCEQFALGNFPLSFLQEFYAQADTDDYFGDSCLVDDDSLPSDILIPGLIVFSKRAPALSAWISGIELAFIKVLMERREVVLECGLNSVYRFAQILDTLKDDVRSFQKMKDAAGGLHFLAVQKSADADEVEGLWLMCEL